MGIRSVALFVPACSMTAPPRPPGEKPSVVVIASQPLFRVGVAHALNSSRAFTVVGQGASTADAQSLSARFAPDLLFADIPVRGALEALTGVTASHPETKSVILTDLEGNDIVECAFRAGVRGYLVKNIGVEELIRAAKIVFRGELYLCQQLVANIFMARCTLPGAVTGESKDLHFGKREEEVLTLLSKGLSNKEIAFRIGICEKTVKYYLTHILRKLGLRNRVEVALYALQRNTR